MLIFQLERWLVCRKINPQWLHDWHTSSFRLVEQCVPTGQQRHKCTRSSLPNICQSQQVESMQVVTRVLEYWHNILQLKTESLDTQILQTTVRLQHNINKSVNTATALSETFANTASGKWAFHCSAPATWNSLSRTVTDSDMLGTFESSPKTFLFCQAFN